MNDIDKARLQGYKEGYEQALSIFRKSIVMAKKALKDACEEIEENDDEVLRK